ncbi:MAG: DUF1801 domain-containing protein [Vicinamibacterales bacterium]
MMRFPTAVRHDPAIDAWLDGQVPGLGPLARTWFDRLRACGRDVRELMHDGCPTACVGDAAFGYVGVYRAHVNVGFYFGAELDDPGGLLEGGGRRMRHVKLRPGTHLDSDALLSLVAASYDNVRRRLAARRDQESGVDG